MGACRGSAARCDGAVAYAMHDVCGIDFCPRTPSSIGTETNAQQTQERGAMADYSKFDPSLASWLQKVWQNGRDIKQEVAEVKDLVTFTKDLPNVDNSEPAPEVDPAAEARKFGAIQVYKLYNPSNSEYVAKRDWMLFLTTLIVLRRHYRVSC